MYPVFGYEGETLAKLTNIYWGYSVTWYGGFVGLFWGFIDGAVAGAALAWVYNKIVDGGAELGAMGYEPMNGA